MVFDMLFGLGVFMLYNDFISLDVFGCVFATFAFDFWLRGFRFSLLCFSLWAYQKLVVSGGLCFFFLGAKCSKCMTPYERMWISATLRSVFK
jgi:hypothetical protein